MKTIFKIVAFIFLLLVIGVIGGIEGELISLITGFTKAIVYIFTFGFFSFLSCLKYKNLNWTSTTARLQTNAYRKSLLKR